MFKHPKDVFVIERAEDFGEISMLGAYTNKYEAMAECERLFTEIAPKAQTNWEQDGIRKMLHYGHVSLSVIQLPLHSRPKRLQLKDTRVVNSDLLPLIDRLIKDAYLNGFVNGMDHTVKNSDKLGLVIPEEMK